jgi:hypothetical protein
MRLIDALATSRKNEAYLEIDNKTRIKVFIDTDGIRKYKIIKAKKDEVYFGGKSDNWFSVNN